MSSPDAASSVSFMKIRNNDGPSTLPCGTPNNTSIQVENSPFRTTCWVLPVNQSDIHFQSCPVRKLPNSILSGSGMWAVSSLVNASVESLRMYFYHMLAKFLGYPAKLVSGASLPMTINDFQYGDFYEYICVNNFLLFYWPFKKYILHIVLHFFARASCTVLSIFQRLDCSLNA